GVGARMVGEVWIGLGNQALERGAFRVPGAPPCLGTQRIPPEHVAGPLPRGHLGQLLIEEGHFQGPGPTEFLSRGFRNGRNGMEPLLREVFDVLALEHATVANEGDVCDAKPGLDFRKLRRKGLWIMRIAWKGLRSWRRPLPSAAVRRQSTSRQKVE